LWTWGVEKEMENDGEMSHVRFLRREGLRWQRRDVIIVAGCMFLIQGWAIVRKLVPLRVRG